MATAKYKELYEHYLGVKLKVLNTFQTVKCPFHDDVSPSASVDVSSGVFKCFSCNVTLSPQKFIRRVTGYDSAEAFGVVKQYGGIETHEKTLLNTRLPSQSLVDTYDKSVEFLRRNETDPEVVAAFEQWYEDCGITRGTLELLHCGYLPNKGITIPYFIGNALASVLIREIDGTKRYVKGSYACLWGLDQMQAADMVYDPYDIQGNIIGGVGSVYLCEGLSDAIRLKQEVPDAIVLGTPGNVFREEWLRELEGIPEVVLFRHADSAGNQLVESAYKFLRERLKIRNIPFRRGQFGNDICDWFATSGLSVDVLLNRNNEVHGGIPGEPVNVGHIKIYDGHALHKFAALNTQESPYITNLIERGELGIILGKAKSRKTLFAMNMMRCLANPGTHLAGIPDFIQGLNEPIKTLLIEEEGSLKSLDERISGILDEKDLAFCNFVHRSGYRIDNSNVISIADSLLMLCKVTKSKVLILDPLQRLVNSDEDGAAETKGFWDALHYMIKLEPELSIFVIHHMTKAGSINSGWDAIRGSSRISGEVDVGIFLESGKEDVTRFRVLGRNISDVRGDLIYRDLRLLCPAGKVEGGVGTALQKAGLKITDVEAKYIDTLVTVYNGVGGKYQVGASAGFSRTWVNKIVSSLIKQRHLFIAEEGKTTMVYTEDKYEEKYGLIEK